MVKHHPFPFTFTICQCKKLLMNLKLLLDYLKSLSLIFVMWLINNKRGIKDHHLVYRQPPPKEPGIGITPGNLTRHGQPESMSGALMWGGSTHLIFFLTTKLVNCTSIQIMVAFSISKHKKELRPYSHLSSFWTGRLLHSQQSPFHFSSTYLS